MIYKDSPLSLRQSLIMAAEPFEMGLCQETAFHPDQLHNV